MLSLNFVSQVLGSGQNGVALCSPTNSDDDRVSAIKHPELRSHERLGKTYQMVRAKKTIENDLMARLINRPDDGTLSSEVNDLVGELKGAVRFAHDISCMLSPDMGTWVGKNPEHLYNPSLNLDGEGLYKSHAAIKEFLALDRLDWELFLPMRRALSQALERSEKENDMGVAVAALRDFARLEAGQTVSKDWKIPYRAGEFDPFANYEEGETNRSFNDGYYDEDEVAFFSSHGSYPDEPDYTNHYMEDGRRRPSWRYWERALSDTGLLREALKNDAVDESLRAHAFQALAPVFQAQNREWREGLMTAVHLVLSLVKQLARPSRRAASEAA